MFVNAVHLHVLHAFANKFLPSICVASFVFTFHMRSFVCWSVQQEEDDFDEDAMEALNELEPDPQLGLIPSVAFGKQTSVHGKRQMEGSRPDYADRSSSGVPSQNVPELSSRTSRADVSACE